MRLRYTLSGDLSGLRNYQIDRQVDRQVNRGIAQSGSAPALGAGCREFESLYPDQLVLRPERETLYVILSAAKDPGVEHTHHMVV